MYISNIYIKVYDSTEADGRKLPNSRSCQSSRIQCTHHLLYTLVYRVYLQYTVYTPPVVLPGLVYRLQGVPPVYSVHTTCCTP